MKKIIIPALLFAAALTSCGSDAVKATDAKEIKEMAITGTYNVLGDNNHIDWKAWHLGKTGERYGKVTLSDAEASVNEGILVGGKFIMDLTSLTVENFGDDTAKTNDLTAHLKTGHFFLTDSFPTAIFEITSVDTTTGDFNSMITGNLTIKGVSKSISFNSNVEITDKTISISSETFEVNREDWGLTYNKEGSVNVPANYLIAKEIAFTIHANLTK